MISETASTAETSGLLMEMVPHLMRWIRRQMRDQRGAGVSILELRTLVIVRHRPGMSLTDVADSLGVTLSYSSKIVDRLVERGLVVRNVRDENRRSIRLQVTPRGRTVLDRARASTEERLAGLLSSLPPGQLAAVAEGMKALKGLQPLLTERLSDAGKATNGHNRD